MQNPLESQLQSEAKQFSKQLTFFLSGLHKYLRPSQSLESSQRTDSYEINIQPQESRDRTQTQVVSEMHDIYNPAFTAKNSINSTQSQPIRDTLGKFLWRIFFCLI
jgi:hypothetical protein